MNQSYQIEALNSMAATRTTLLLARLFGKKRTVIDSMGNICLLSTWRGTTYLIGIQWAQGIGGK